VFEADVTVSAGMSSKNEEIIFCGGAPLLGKNTVKRLSMLKVGLHSYQVSVLEMEAEFSSVLRDFWKPALN
jgi:hypothetical protein